MIYSLNLIDVTSEKFSKLISENIGCIIEASWMGYIRWLRLAVVNESNSNISASWLAGTLVHLATHISGVKDDRIAIQNEIELLELLGADWEAEFLRNRYEYYN